MFTIFPWWYVIFSCFKQSPLNFTLALVPIKSSYGLMILFGVVGGSILSSDNPLDFHDKIILGLSPAILKTYGFVEILTNFVCHHLQNDFYHKNRQNQVFLFFSIHFQ